ncbi:uncharacterized protein MAM_05978 [Metarhizium album ARSEF 1941]|uniref:Uncharacterized protein n=1 Tax=Metarhizium album (strain ARSEF 1941) TaxID=1081103 RepID=A0A0B2WT34_METAS|nr:uncharacterized protein MAM_05978 [Metarhizium album ARSEF 1941]KHN96130.1 hypothetical protein MAM_05978 [Metarhizium album ARSEF 1941]
MEEDGAMVCCPGEAGEPGSPDSPPSLSDGDEMQESDLMIKLGFETGCQTELDHDEQAESPCSVCHADEACDESANRIQRSNAATSSIPTSGRLCIDTGFELDEDDYEALRFPAGTLGRLRRLAASVSRAQSQKLISSPATPGTQIIGESQAAVRQLASPIQFQPRGIPRSCRTSPVQAHNVLRKPPRRPRRRAYQLLERETAEILNGRNLDQENLNSDRNGVSTRRKKLGLASKSSSNSKQKSTSSKTQVISSATTWTVAPKARLEVVLQTRHKSWLAAYQDVDVSGKNVTARPTRGGHRGRGRRRALRTAPKRTVDRAERRAEVVSKNTSRGRPRNTSRRVIGGKAGAIGTRRSRRMNAGKLDSTNKKAASGGSKPVAKAVAKSATHRGRSSGVAKRRGRPPTRGRVSNRRN